MTASRKLQVSAQQVRRLLDDIKALPPEPLGTHLSDDELVAYAMEQASSEEVEALDAHLASCLDCTTTLGQLLDVADVWRGAAGQQRLAAMQDGLRTALATTHTFLWLQVTRVVVLTAVTLARTRQHGLHFDAERLFQRWRGEEVSCVLREDEQGFVFAVDTTQAAYQDSLMRFVLAEATTGEAYAAGWLVLHTDPLNEGHYVASTRLDSEVTLPEHCQPRLARVELQPEQPPDDATLLAAAAAATRQTDRQAWCHWAQRQAQAGHLAWRVVEAICQDAITE